MAARDNITILLSGAPGTGKSTIQRLAPDFLRARLGEAAAFGTDEVYQLLDPEWEHNSERLRHICKSNCIALALNLFRNGIRVVVIAGNALYDERNVNDYFHALSAVSSVYHFTLLVPVSELAERVRARGDGEQHPREWLAAWVDLVQRHAGAWTHLIETAQHTPVQTLEHMLAIIKKGPKQRQR